jgi:hypothetical protein
LADVLPRLDVLHHPAVASWLPLTLFVTDVANHDRLQLLRRLAPPGLRIQPVPIGTRVRADRYVHLPSLTEDVCACLPAPYVQRFRRAAEDCFQLAGMAPGDERVYVSRQRARMRRILNEAELAAALSSHGFRSYVLEDMPLAEQAMLFRRASIVVGPHGAGLTNLLFGGARCRVLELFPGVPYPHYRWLAGAMGYEYANVCGPSPAVHTDFSVDVAAVCRRLGEWFRVADAQGRVVARQPGQDRRAPHAPGAA